MTAIQLVNLWQRQRRIDQRLYEMLMRRLVYPPFSPSSLNIVGVSAERFKELVDSGEIGQVRGIGSERLVILQQLVKSHDLPLYVDVEQMMRLSEATNAY